jgi:RNA polymerase sigma-70 factor (ECF subfamily)
MGSGHREKAMSQLGLANHIRTSPGLPAFPVSLERPSFEDVYRAHAKTVARWAIRLLGPTGDYEDVVQEVFLVARRRLSEFRGEAAISTWLYEITVRIAQGFRKRARWWSWVTGRGKSPSRGQARAMFVPTAEMSDDPQLLLEARERTRVLYQLLDTLAEDQRTAFILFEIEGLSGEAIAAITGASVSTVWVRLSRARRNFMKHMHAWEAREQP